MNKGRVSIHVCSRDRHSEVALLLQSLRTQTFKEFDIVLLDDASGSPITSCHFLMSIIARMKLENHKFKLLRNEISQGVCYARNKCIDEDKFDNEFTCRLDDDCILEQDYLKLLLGVISQKYDLATGVVPLIHQPELIRSKTSNDIVCKHKIDKKGNLIENVDELGFCYDLFFCARTVHQFRTNALYKSSMHKKVRYPTNLTKVGFREEGFFSLKALSEGYKLGVDLSAVAFHLQSPSGGCRQTDYNECVAIDHKTFLDWIKANKNKLGMLQ